MTVLILVLVVVSILLYVSATYDSVILSSVQVLSMMAIQTTANTNSCLVSILCNMQQLGNISFSLRVHLGLGGGGTTSHPEYKVLNFYLQALSAKGWSPKGRRGKENTLPAKQQGGFEPGTF